MFRHLMARSGEPFESVVEGHSMEGGIPAGARVLIRERTDDEPRVGQVVAFLANGRIMVHRVIHVGHSREGPFAITHGDGNWVCDPPIGITRVAGVVEQYRTGAQWTAIGPARTSLPRRALGWPVFALLRAAMWMHPSVADRLARGLSRARMAVRALRYHRSPTRDPLQ